MEHKVEVSGDVPEALSGDLVCSWSVSGVRVSTPIVVDCWEVHNSHENVESKKGSEFFYSDW